MDAMWQAEIRVDLDAIRHNVGLLRAGTSAQVLAVVKANGYGHGMVPVARAALEAGAVFLGVAMVAEGVRLRQEGVGTSDGGRAIPILVMGAALEGQAEAVAAHGLSQVVTRPELAAAL